VTPLDDVERTFRDHSGRAVATLVRLFGDIDIAEESVQEAFVTAIEKWPRDGIPPSPAGWIITTARNRGIDRLRRESTRTAREIEAIALAGGVEPVQSYDVRDDQLRLVFTCCHPALAQPAQIALTLRLIAGLQTPEIARAFLVPEPTMAQRIVRAKNKIRAANIPYRIPSATELPDRLTSVLAVIYLVFNEGFVASGGESLSRTELASEAVRLGRLLHELMPDEPEVAGLLALILLDMARQPARAARDGSLVRLADQNRSLWNRELIDEGQDIVRACIRRNQPGPYQIQAAIAAVHSDAPTAADTDWSQILALYDQQMALAPTPVVALNRAVALAEVHGPSTALAIVERIDLPDYYLRDVVRADLLERLGRKGEARIAYDSAIARTSNEAEHALLASRRDALGASDLS
jgi:RNA polymerase sigma-70 factor, ECF subfamily